MLAAVLAASASLVFSTQSSASADDVPCSGSLQVLKTFYYNGAAIGEVQLYTPSAGHHCAKLVKLGVTRGVSSEIGIQIRKCTQTSGTTCTVVAGTGDIDNGSYAYYAGPVGVVDGSNCFRVTGDMFWPDGSSNNFVYNHVFC